MSPNARLGLRRIRALALMLVGAVLFTAPVLPAEPAPPARSVVVLREHGAGTPSRAQPYLDQLLAVLAKQAAWPKVTGRYFAERSALLDFVRTDKPDFGIFSLAAFLSLKSSLSLTVVGEVVAPKAGGTKYYLVSKRARELAGCKSQRVATTFSSDPKFVDRVVSGGSFRLADFTVVAARRPLEPLKQVLRDEAECALIDDAQLEAARHIEQGGELKPVWESSALPGMAVVAFPRADAAAIATFRKTLGGLCTGAREACTTVGIESIRPAGNERYQAVLAAHAK